MTLVGFSCLAVVFISVVIMVLIFYKTVVKKKKKSHSISVKIGCLDLYVTKSKEKDIEMWEVNLTVEYFFSSCI